VNDKLNKKYLKTRKEYKRNATSRIWIVIPILIVALIIAKLYSDQEELNQKRTNIESIQETENGIINLLSNSPKTKRREIIRFNELGFEIELHENLKYSRYPNQNFIVAQSGDSTFLSYLIGEIPEALKSGDIDEKWKQQLKQGNNSYQFIDSLDLTYLSTNENNQKHLGFYRIDKSGEKYYILQASILEEEYENQFQKMMTVLNSFRKLEK